MAQLSLLEKTVLQKLDDGEFHSGRSMSIDFAVSRTAIWKVVKSLIENHSVEIESRRGVGYRLNSKTNLLDQNVLRVELEKIGCGVFCFDQVESTNDKALYLIKHKNYQSVVVTAEQQTAGRGRRGRVWQSAFAKGIWLSFACKVDGLSALKCYSLIAAVILCDILRRHFLEDFFIKWPNDIYFKNEKLAGILVEITGDPDSELFVVTGLGINVDVGGVLDGVIDQPFTDLYSISGNSVDRHPLIIEIVNSLSCVHSNMSESMFFRYMSKWNDFDYLCGRSVVVYEGGREFEGIAEGVNEDGELIVRSGVGDVSCVSSGEVSVRVVDKKCGESP